MKILIQKFCIICHKEFYVIPCRKHRKCCSRKCFKKRCLEYRNTSKVEITCLWCKNIFEVLPSLKNNRKFCSLSCASNYNQKDGSWNKGIPVTEEIKTKIGLGVKKSRPKDWINPSTRPEIRKKISRTMLKEGTTKGENNGRYIDGKCHYPYSEEFTEDLKEQIRNRDNRECQLCHKTEQELLGYRKKLDVHHIDYNKMNCSEENLLSLCNSCHMKLHGGSIC